jgi:hypothetical protein
MEQQSPEPPSVEHPATHTASPIVTLGNIANVNAVEVRADGIYRSSNQLEVVKAVSRTPSAHLNAEKTPTEAEEELTAAVNEVALEKGAVQSPDDAEKPEPQSQQQEVPPAEDLMAENSGAEVSEPRLYEYQATADALVSASEDSAVAAMSRDLSERRKRDSIVSISLKINAWLCKWKPYLIGVVCGCPVLRTTRLWLKTH